MKKTAFALVFLAGIGQAVAQTDEGVVYYDQKMNLHRNARDDVAKTMMPEFRTTKMVLVVRGDESLYKAAETDDEETETSEGGNVTRMVFKGNQNETYCRFGANTLIELRDLAGQKFLVEDTLRRRAWKLDPGATREIAGYRCTRATVTEKRRVGKIVMNSNSEKRQEEPATPEMRDVLIEAWFTEAIPCPSGPGNYGGLPGLLLEVNINDGEQVTTATRVGLQKVDDKMLRLSPGGKRVTNENFRKRQEDYLKELNAGAGMRIIRN